MSEDIEPTPEELAVQHSAWIARWFAELELPENKGTLVRLLEMCYRDAFEHGFKHGVEAAQKYE